MTTQAGSPPYRPPQELEELLEEAEWLLRLYFENDPAVYDNWLDRRDEWLRRYRALEEQR